MMPKLRQFCVVVLLSLPLLAACKLELPGKGGDAAPDAAVSAEAGANPITGDAVEVTPLDAPSAASAPAAAASPEVATPAKAAPGPQAAAEDGAPAEGEAAVEEAPPPPPKPPEQIACEKTGGQWVSAGAEGVKSCVKMTSDAGKSCTRGTQCQGDCLARSQTCSPIAPLFGCNEILQDDGVRTTLCRD